MRAPTFDPLSTEDRIRLVLDLWDEIAVTPKQVGATDEERAESYEAGAA